MQSSAVLPCIRRRFAKDKIEFHGPLNWWTGPAEGGREISQAEKAKDRVCSKDQLVLLFFNL